MSNLTRASNELFRRTPDECFVTINDLWQHCQEQKDWSVDRWHPPQCLVPKPEGDRLNVALGDDGAFQLNDWSFGQLCNFAGVSKDTVNRLSAETASRAFRETLPSGNKPLQVLTLGQSVRSIHGASYTRVYNVDLVTMLREFATDFEPPPKGMNGGTGLYCGEQDMFCFMIDPAGWAEIDGEAFAPGFFLWNSEVGKRSLGVQSFWFQAVCKNHIVWDAVEVADFSRKHTANVHDSFAEIRRIIAALVEKRDQRRDGFVEVIRKAMQTKLGSNAEEVAGVLSKSGIARSMAKKAIEIAEQQGRFTIFALVDALTRVSGELKNAGERIDADQKAAQLLALAGSESGTERLRVAVTV